jgi:hypothetical protein
MRIFYFIIFIALSAYGYSQAQHFVFDPTDHYENTVSSTNYSDHGVFMENLTGGELILGWERLAIDFPEEWVADLCDYVSCYIGIPESGTMLPISDTTRGFLKITLNPNGRVGTGTVSFRVFDHKHPNIADTLYFTIHTQVMTAVPPTFADHLVDIFPNPVYDLVNIKAQISQPFEMILMDMNGQAVMNQRLNPGSLHKFDMSFLPEGMYFLMLQDEKRIFAREKVMKQ